MTCPRSGPVSHTPVHRRRLRPASSRGAPVAWRCGDCVPGPGSGAPPRVVETFDDYTSDPYHLRHAAMASSSSPQPTALTLHQASRVLEIGFDDGSLFHIPFELMRI